MNKFLRLLIISLSIFILSSCSVQNRNPALSEPASAKLVNYKTSKPIVPIEKFSQSDPAVYFSVKATDLPKNTKLKAVWKHIDNGTEVQSEITTEGTGYEVFTLKRNSDLFPLGQYEVTVTAIVDGKTLEVKGKFSIAADVKPIHFSNPVTARSVDNEEKLNPVNIAAEFTQSDPVIYFIVQSKDLPKGTNVSCLWIHMDSGDTLTHQITTDGSRNIAFSLKSEGSQKLPVGKYIATVSSVINGETESVWKEFEVK